MLKQALEKLRVRADWRSDPRRIEREALGIQTLEQIAPPGAITPLVFLDAGRHLLAMQAVPKPHENWKSILMSGWVESDHVRQFARLLAAIHSAGYLRRAEFETPFGDTSFFESLRLEPYYLYAGQRMPAVEPFIVRLVADTRRDACTLVHGDYSPKNVLVRAGRLILLDHEVIHFGDGAFDLGFGLTHLLSKADALAAHREAFATAARLFWETYRAVVVVAGRGAVGGAGRPQHAGMLAGAVHRAVAAEYLDPPRAARQANAASAMMDDPPTRVEQMIASFLRRIG